MTLSGKPFSQRRTRTSFTGIALGKQWKALFVRPEVPDISHKFDNVMFEIQVTCLAEGLCNKLAHPLLYKENSGSISRKMRWSLT
ncbi:unnamed protein product [Clonostachys rosea f. rosea IK726]|uniref:Uncharacterized protein n=1 Tax=Clonostachys rosea f. rosea IK726 TaxID=1349383 RepID=A0ACA9U3V4_BIOOC|nr:unnamed protein product [Clonostachys rosea f. rosea IK726]